LIHYLERLKEKPTMADANSKPEEMIPLTPTVFHILLALADRELHGYGIMKQVAADTRDRMQMGPGTLYGSIKRMLAADLIEESDERPDPILDDERRRYYRLTRFGRKVLAEEMDRLSSALVVAAERGLLDGSWPEPSKEGA
jgi:DNA-binding PadR family transcriptional regulator